MRLFSSEFVMVNLYLKMSAVGQILWSMLETSIDG